MTASTANRPHAGAWGEHGTPSDDARDGRDARPSRTANSRRHDRKLVRMLHRAGHLPRPPMPARTLSWWRELLLVAVLYTVYEFTRGLHQGGLDKALANGRAILHWEQVSHLDPEDFLNQALGHMTWLAVIASYFYSTMHYLVTPAVLIWMYRKHADHYRFARTTLAIATISGLAGFYLLPTAPPRLLAGSGLEDTLESVSNWGWWDGDGSVPRGLGGLSNQFAAMPSLHVGWAIWSGALLAMYATRRWVRVLGVLYPVATSLVVMATGNHYLLDVLAGAVVMGWGALVTLGLDHWRRSKQTSPDGRSSAHSSELELAG